MTDKILADAKAYCDAIFEEKQAAREAETRVQTARNIRAKVHTALVKRVGNAQQQLAVQVEGRVVLIKHGKPPTIEIIELL